MITNDINDNYVLTITVQTLEPKHCDRFVPVESYAFSQRFHCCYTNI